MDKTLVKGIHVLETIANSDSPMSVSEVAETCGIARSNAHRVLSTLLSLGYLSQDESTRRYRMTIRVWALGSKLVDRLDFNREAVPFLEKLNQETGETTHLSVLNGYNVIYINKLEARHAVRTYTRIGGIAPAFCVATGRAMLAYQNDDAIEDAIKDAIAQAVPFTENTLTDPEALREELRLTRLRGYAVNRGEWYGGSYGIAVPIFSATNQVIAAIGISAPAERLPEDCIEQLAIFIKDLGQKLSRNLGANDASMAESSSS